MKTAIEILQENVDFYLELEEVAKIVKAMEEYAKEYHDSEVKKLRLQNVTTRFSLINFMLGLMVGCIFYLAIFYLKL